jgi:AcrR family transcriptional regulator
MEMLAVAVGIRKASVYYYFKTKDALLVEIHEEMIDHLLGRAREREGAPTERLRGVMRDLVELMELYPGRLQIFFEHYRELPAAQRPGILAKRDAYQDILLGVLREGVAVGEFTLDDVDLAALSILGMCNWTYQWMRPGGRLSATQVADGFLHLFLAGAAGPKT